MSDFLGMPSIFQDVSRETMDRLMQFTELVKKWNPAINLISKSSLPHLWDRHIADSAQLHDYLPENAEMCLDIGSGGGFPGIVLAVISAEKHPARRYTLVDSDQRKATFLRETIRTLGLQVDVKSERIESLSPLFADVLSARADAPLSHLLSLALSHLHADGVCLFPKGENFLKEIEDARRLFTFELTSYPSRTDAGGAILKIHGIQNA